MRTSDFGATQRLRMILIIVQIQCYALTERVQCYEMSYTCKVKSWTLVSVEQKSHSKLVHYFSSSN